DLLEHVRRHLLAGLVEVQLDRIQVAVVGRGRGVEALEVVARVELDGALRQRRGRKEERGRSQPEPLPHPLPERDHGNPISARRFAAQASRNTLAEAGSIFPSTSKRSTETT